MTCAQHWEHLVFCLWCQRHFGDIKLKCGKELKTWESAHKKYDSDDLHNQYQISGTCKQIFFFTVDHVLFIFFKYSRNYFCFECEMAFNNLMKAWAKSRPESNFFKILFVD